MRGFLAGPPLACGNLDKWFRLVSSTREGIEAVSLPPEAAVADARVLFLTWHYEPQFLAEEVSTQRTPLPMLQQLQMGLEGWVSLAAGQAWLRGSLGLVVAHTPAWPLSGKLLVGPEPLEVWGAADRGHGTQETWA